MATQLRDSYGRGGRARRGRRRDPWAAPRSARPEWLEEQSKGYRRGRQKGPRRASIVDLVLVTAGVAVVGFLGWAAWEATRVDVRLSGIDDGVVLTAARAAELEVTIEIAQQDRLGAASVTLDGTALPASARVDSGFRWASGGPMPTGDHELVLTVPRPLLPASRFVWRFSVDATPPTIEAPTLLDPVEIDSPVVIEGTVEVGARLTADGAPVEVGDDGRFTLRYRRPPAGSVLLRVADEAGHVVFHEVFTPVRRAPVRGVHVSGAGWATLSIRQQIFQMIDERRIDTVQLDLKDELGEVAYASRVPLARRIGATRSYYDLEDVVDELHRRGVRVVGRVVAFRDPILAGWADANGEPGWLVRRPDGSAHEAYGGFTNLASPDVLSYNLAIAEEAVAAGVDEILWDYIRRPEGDLAGMVFEGLEGTPEDGIVAFLDRTHGPLRAAGVLQGASVFGVAAQEPTSIGQDVPRMARHVDYLAPMVYPSLFGIGQYRVPDPLRMPYEIVSRSLRDFQNQVAGTGVTLTPWLQDFSLGGVTYREDQVRAQIEAARSLGIEDWLLWNPRVRYHSLALDPR